MVMMNTTPTRDPKQKFLCLDEASGRRRLPNKFFFAYRGRQAGHTASLCKYTDKTDSLTRGVPMSDKLECLNQEVRALERTTRNLISLACIGTACLFVTCVIRDI